MSIPSAKEIELQLTVYDVQVRRAIESCTIHEYMGAHGAEIKAFYKSCKHVKGEALAAFDASRFINQFLRDWRNNEDSEEFFLRRQQGKIREFDGVERPPYTLPPTPPPRRRGLPLPALAVAGAGPHTAAARAAKERAAMEHAAKEQAAKEQAATEQAAKERAVKEQAAWERAAREKAAREKAASEHAARERTVHFAARAASPPSRLFSTLDRDDSDVEMGEQGKRDLESDVEYMGKGKMKAKAKMREWSDEGQEVPPPPSHKSKKPPAKAAKVQTEDEAEDSDHDHTVIVSRPKPKPRPLPVPTGEYHEPPCDQCLKLQRHCEKERSGRACVSCKRNKHRCNYSFPNAPRNVKSKPQVEESEDDAAGSGAATSSRPARPAAKRAKQAIQADAATAPKPSRRNRKKSTPPGINLGPDTDDERMSSMEKRLREAHNKLDGAIMGLDKASRLERCERKLDRLTLLLEAVCDRVGVTVSSFGEEEPAVKPAASTSEEQEPTAASMSAELQPAASTSTSAIPPLPALTVIPPTPHHSQDTEMRGVVSSRDSTPEPAPPATALTLDEGVSTSMPDLLTDVDMPAAQEVTGDAAKVTANAAALPDSGLAASEVTQEAAASSNSGLAASQVTQEAAASSGSALAASSDSALAAFAAADPSTALQVRPLPKPRSRKKTPVPTGPNPLLFPERSTRSMSRSRSPSPLPDTSGGKRKAEDGSADGESAAKKARA